MDCKGCEHRQECYSVVVSDFKCKDDKLITMNETHSSKFKCSKRKGAKIMKANDLLVYGILKCHDDGLTREEILKELTYIVSYSATFECVKGNISTEDSTEVFITQRKQYTFIYYVVVL